MKKILVIALLVSSLFVNFVFAEGYKIRVSLPGAPKGTEVRDPSEYIGILFKTGLAIAGVLALVFLLYGAILYTVSSSRGNVQGESEAKERIQSVFLGLGLLLLSYLILYTINPDLVKLKMPKVKVSPEVPKAGSKPLTPEEAKKLKKEWAEWKKECMEKAVEECKGKGFCSEDILKKAESDSERLSKEEMEKLEKCVKCINEAYNKYFYGLKK